jgi:hypothetical protein
MMFTGDAARNAKGKLKEMERRRIRAEYKDANHLCELAPYFPRDGRDAVIMLGKVRYFVSAENEQACELHHIWSLGRRPDEVSNLIHLSWQAHRWFHDHIPEGRAVCLYAKALKGEFDREVMRAVAGKCVVGWAECQKFEGWVEKCRVRFLEMVGC